LSTPRFAGLLPGRRRWALPTVPVVAGVVPAGTGVDIDLARNHWALHQGGTDAHQGGIDARETHNHGPAGQAA